MTQDNNTYCGLAVRLWPVLGALVALTASGCASSGTTLARPDQGDGRVIYRISEEGLGVHGPN